MKQRLAQFLRRVHADKRGAMSVEKVLILGLIALPIVIILVLFAKWAKDWFNTQADTLKQDAG